MEDEGSRRKGRIQTYHVKTIYGPSKGNRANAKKDFMKQNFLVCRCDFDSQQCFIHNKCHKCKSLPAVNQKSSVQKSIHTVIRIFYCFWRAWHVGQTNWDFMCQCRIWMTFYLCTPDIRGDVCMATLSRLHLSVCITIS